MYSNDKIRNEELGQQITLIDKIGKRRLTRFAGTSEFGHVTRLEGLLAVALYEQVEGTRSRRRKPKKWMDNVEEDLTAQGMNMREAVDNSRNRKTWRCFVEASS